MKTYLHHDHGPGLRALAGHLAHLIAVTYAAGWVTGGLIHQINSELCYLVTGRRGIAAPPRPPVAPAVPPRPRPMLEDLKVVELRQLAREAGFRALARSGRRQQLLEVLA